MPTPASHVWQPSIARLLVMDEFVPVPRGTLSSAPFLLEWPPKDPADVLDYAFDISPALTGNGGDAVATLDVTITPANPGGLALASAAADGARVVLWLTAGQADTVYTVTLTIGTQAGRTLSRSVLLPVLPLANAGVLADQLTTDTGVALVDQLGQPIVLEN